MSLAPKQKIVLAGAALSVVAAVLLERWLNPPTPGSATGDGTDATIALDPPLGGRSAELAGLRRDADGAALDAFLSAQRGIAEASPTDPATWRVLAEAHLERLLWRDRNRGMSRGTPTHTELPAPHRADLDAGLAAAAKAIDLDDPTGDAWRIRGALLSLSITGLGDFMRLRGEVKEMFAAAAERAPGNPRLAYLRASELLFTPGWLGGDPGAAAERLQRLAEVLAIDERPLVALGLARHLQGDEPGAVSALEAALVRAPANRYAAEVARRLRAGEKDAFARDVTD